MKGLDTKNDPNQIQVGNFLQLTNSVFTTGGRLTKRNGFSKITTLPNTAQTTLTTYATSLVATGSNLYAYSPDNTTWYDKGNIQPVDLTTLPLVRSSTSQTSCDGALAPNNLYCSVYNDSNGNSYYNVTDSSTGEQIVYRQQLPATSVNPRVFILGTFFAITYLETISGTAHLQLLAVPWNNPTVPNNAVTLSTTANTLQAGYDGIVTNNFLFVAWAFNSSSTKMVRVDTSISFGTAITIDSSHAATLVSMTIDDFTPSSPVIWISYYVSGSSTGYATSYNISETQLTSPTSIITSTTVDELTSVASDGVLTFFYEVKNTYGYDSNLQTDYIKSNTLTLGSLGTAVTVLRSVGLASKAFFYSNTIYMLVAYSCNNIASTPVLASNQPSYFLIDSNGNIIMKLAYSNGGGYESSQILPSVSFNGTSFLCPYLVNDFIASVNKQTNLPVNSQVNAIYAQTGINLAMFSINTSGQFSSEIASVLNLTGGQLWMYDGVKPVEQGFDVWPENIEVTTTTGSGGLTAQTYFYQFTYEWTDNTGNIHRSAPSIPVSQVTTTSSSTNTIHVPTLRLTSKQPNPVGIAASQPVLNPVRIVGYRWSTAQQEYFQFTSLTSPTLNDPTIDYVTFTDANADSAIIGNNLIYTNGGIVEDIGAPACSAVCLFKSRLFLVDAEDRNLLWYSKQVIENTPVEMSDLFTIYVAPTIGAQGSTGPITALAAMDDKLIIFKKDAIYYLTGEGPDNTGANNDFSEPIYITASVGTTNPNSIVLMPSGLMFQSDKGIWLLGRDLSTNYLGAPVEAYNNQTVESGLTIPGTNQVRFTLTNNVTLMYDYYYNQWGTFSNLNALSATLYNGYHTYLNSFGQVYQESPGQYLDGTNPVLMSFQTGWLNVAGIRGYERFYYALLLGQYFTPFKLNMSFSYDYSQAIQQTVTIQPDNYIPNWGGDPLWGTSTPWGGPGNTFQARVFPQRQKCQTFQLTVQELYDPSFGVSPGEGLTLSGMNLVCGVKKGYSIQKASRSFG